jgi:putative hydrolase of HD superfamily
MGRNKQMMIADDTRLIEVLRNITSAFDARAANPIGDIGADVDAILNGFRLQTVRRYFHQVYWWDETKIAEKADRIESDLKLENVAAHSWHVADVVLLLADRFEGVSPDRALRLALLHDKLEMFTGDFDPVGVHGTGSDTHAFNASARDHKIKLERAALDIYLSSLRPSARDAQRKLIEENLEASTLESRFVKAVDKIQALAFVHEKKQGLVSDDHLVFSLRYSLLAVGFFPELSGHYLCLARRFLERIASHRGIAVEALLEIVDASHAARTGWEDDRNGGN